MEIKTVDSPCGRYLVYADGRIYSKYADKFLKPKVFHTGTLGFITYPSKFSQKSVTWGRFVYEAFYGPLSSNTKIFPIDGNKNNCSLANLKTVTKSEFPRFKKLTILPETQKDENNHTFYKTICDCGRQAYRTRYAIQVKQSCPCSATQQIKGDYFEKAQ